MEWLISADSLGFPISCGELYLGRNDNDCMGMSICLSGRDVVNNHHNNNNNIMVVNAVTDTNNNLHGHKNNNIKTLISSFLKG